MRKFDEEMEKESAETRRRHRAIVNFLDRALNGAKNPVVNTSFVIISHAPSGPYLANTVGFLEDDELMFGLEIAKKTITSKFQVR